MARRVTDHVRQLRTMYSHDNGRLTGEEGWKKFPLFWFILFLSYKCTRRCDYCYAYNQVGDGNDSEMDENTFSRLLDWIPEVWRANRVKVNTIGFLGGEPLLRTDRIRKVMDSAYRNTEGMQGFLYTNGDLVDSVNWDDLEDVQWISTNITDTAIRELGRRMSIIRDRSNVIGQTLVATLDDYNLERILDVTRYGVENGHRLRYYKNFYERLDGEYKTRLLKRYHELCDLLEDYVTRGYDVHTTFLLDILIPLWDSDSSPYPCGKRIAVVYPDGVIGPCIRDHAFRTGSIFDPDPLSAIQCHTFHYGLREYDLPDECMSCESKAVCQGGCPHDKLVVTGTTYGKSVACEIHKEIIPRLRRIEKMKRPFAAKPRDIAWAYGESPARSLSMEEPVRNNPVKGQAGTVSVENGAR